MEQIEKIRNLITEKKQQIKERNQKTAPIKAKVTIKEQEIFDLKLEIIESDNKKKILEDEIEELQVALGVLEKIESPGLGE